MTEETTNSDAAALDVALETPLAEPTSLTEAEREDLEEAESEAEPITYSVSDFDVEGLVNRFNRGDILVPSFGIEDEDVDGAESAAFQRGFVWRKGQMDRFIESILLGFPIPQIMLILQTDRRYLVLDGQQRIKTLAKFQSGLHARREFSLENVADGFKGMTYKSLGTELSRKFNDTFIQATIVKTDGTAASLDAIYQVFERLNSGGTQLTPHEIRIALYPGPLVERVQGLNLSTDWRALYGGARSPRVRDHELILRILAMFHGYRDYKRPLKRFLNRFLGDHRSLDGLNPRITDLFMLAASSLNSAGGPRIVRFQSRQVNAALTEALFVGIMSRLDGRESDALDAEAVAAKVAELLANGEFVDAISGSTGSVDAVTTRIGKSIEAFAGL